MGQENYEKEIAEKVEAYRVEAATMLVNAFNEGYYLGKMHAQKVLGGKDED